MLSFTIGDQTYDVPISWDDVTFDKYLEWVNEWVMQLPDAKEAITGEHPFSQPEMPLRMLSFQTDIPYEVLSMADMNGVDQIAATQLFWTDFELLNASNYIPSELTTSIDDAPAQYMIEFVHGLKALGGRQPINLAPDLIKNYYGIDILPEPVTKYYGLATFFLTKSAAIGLKSSNRFNLSLRMQMKLRQVLRCFKVSV